MPRYGGRQKGSVNRLAKEAIEQAKAGGKLPHEWLLDIMRGEPVKQKVWDIQRDPQTGLEIGRKLKEDTVYPDIDTRVDAAKACAPFFAPKLATQQVSLTGPDDGPIELKGKLDDAETVARIAALLERAGRNAAAEAD